MTMITTNDGVELHYEDVGAGRPLIMIAGWACSHRLFDKNIAALAESCRAIAVDMRGHGDSAKVCWGHRIARYAKDVSDVIEALFCNMSHCSGPAV